MNWVAFKLIDEIEKIRSKNNKNWMDILRLAFLAYPDQAKELMGKISENDAEINSLTKKLAGE